MTNKEIAGWLKANRITRGGLAAAIGMHAGSISNALRGHRQLSKVAHVAIERFIQEYN